jgi:hypothetical protein
MSEENKPKKRDWIDIGTKVLTPIVAGLLIAWAGFVSNYTLTDISNKQESARLITELQIRREQAESDLRKDVFDQTLQAFLLKNREQDDSISGMSKQMLRLELLSLNFGDSLSLSPLFKELRSDLKNLKPVEQSEISTFHQDRGELRKRLYSLARRVASTQVSSLDQHGVSKTIHIPLVDYSPSTVMPCDAVLYEESFPWPEREIQRNFGIYDENNKLLMTDVEIQDMFASDEDKAYYRKLINDSRLVQLQGIKRYLEVNVSDVDHCAKSAKVTVIIYREREGASQQPLDLPVVEDRGGLSLISNEGLQIEVKRSFVLDYFNFPMVDNTRLGSNHRFAIVLDEFDLKSNEPYMELIGMVFPSEYASLRDRPGMEEARKLLESALDNNKSD